ncbi:hypothetical protein KKC13_03820 [bacterium]|nr:hypothetical protein [bacterium]MBU1957288.1 hypothetical protein [bacterium]
MYFLRTKKNMVLKVLSLLFIFHTTLLAGNTYDQGSKHMSSGCASELMGEDGSVGTQEQAEIVMNCFGGMSMTIMLLLTSLLGAFFIRDEFASLLE